MGRAQHSRRVRERNSVTLIERIQQVGSPKYVEDPDPKSGKTGPESGERDEGQGRGRPITIRESASERSSGKPKATVVPQIRGIGMMRSSLRLACKSLYISRRGDSRIMDDSESPRLVRARDPSPIWFQ
jgi:hypothetical protein